MMQKVMLSKPTNSLFRACTMTSSILFRPVAGSAVMRSFSTKNDEADDYSGYAGRSSLFGKDPYLETVKKRMQREYHEDDRYEADESARKQKERLGEQRKTSFKAEMVYSADIVSVLEMFSRKLSQDPESIHFNHEFYHACLDRIDILLTEKNSQV